MEFIVRRKDSSELYHHGVPGQKWGSKNGPPYPLKLEDKIKAGYIKAKNKVSETAKKIKNSPNKVVRSSIRKHGKQATKSFLKIAADTVAWGGTAGLAGRLYTKGIIPFGFYSAGKAGVSVIVSKFLNKTIDAAIKDGVDAKTKAYVQSEIKKRLAEYENQHKEAEHRDYTDYLIHSRGPWKTHKYIKKVGGRYYYKTGESSYTGLDLFGLKDEDEEDDSNGVFDPITGTWSKPNAKKNTGPTAIIDPITGAVTYKKSGSGSILSQPIDKIKLNKESTVQKKTMYSRDANGNLVKSTEIYTGLGTKDLVNMAKERAKNRIEKNQKIGETVKENTLVKAKQFLTDLKNKRKEGK